MITFIAICVFFIALPVILMVLGCLMIGTFAMLALVPKWFWTILGIAVLWLILTILDGHR